MKPSESEMLKMYKEHKKMTKAEMQIKYELHDNGEYETLSDSQKLFMESDGFQKILKDVEGQVSKMGNRTTAEIIMLLNNYRLAYDILMEFFDNIPEEDKASVSAQLEMLGL